MVLNDMSDEEWASHKMPPISSCHPHANEQLPALGYALVPQAMSDLVEVGVTLREVEDRSSRLCHPECVPGLGGESFCLFEDTPSPLPHQAGSKPGRVKPPSPPCNTHLVLGTKLTGGDFSLREGLMAFMNGSQAPNIKSKPWSIDMVEDSWPPRSLRTNSV